MMNPQSADAPGDQSTPIDPAGTQPLPATITAEGQSSANNDQSLPFYLHPSHSPGMLFMNSTFNDNIYGASFS